MRIRFTLLLTGIFLFFVTGEAFCQQVLVSPDKKKELDVLSAKAKTAYTLAHIKALNLAHIYGWPLSRKTRNGGFLSLQGVNKLGFPVYLVTDDNIISAATTNTTAVQPGGSLGLNLSGSSSFLNDKLAIWDGGSVYTGHQEFAGKTILIKDTSVIIDHATHVSGTMLAKGVYPPVKGMAFNATTLHSYDFNNDIGEMAAASPSLLLSNHSYGDEAGWNFDDAYNRWEWLGLPGDTIDYSFGFYSDRTQAFDQIAYKAPYYLIVESAGNARGNTGPAVGADYYGFVSISNHNFVDKGARPVNISSNNSYDCISTTGNAKNILTVGAINPLPNGPTNAQSISTTFFSSWGPTDDGRVKPDIVANGLNVLSCGSSGPTSYITLSGTSQAAPNVTGSLYLLQEYYAEKHGGAFMRSATLKGLACHTAFDAGNVGPDYIYGWGLLNMKTAAQAITDNGTKSTIKESTLTQGQTQTYNVVASGNGPLMATIAWTDPEGNITPDGTINDRTPKLVNDLDIRISDGTTIYFPWVLDPNNPSALATKGDNIRDNVEQVYIANAIPGRAYTITVSHKGTLQSGPQAYSLIATGIGGTAYCASGPLSSADSRINNVTFSNINNTPAAGCTTYSDYTNLTVQLEQNKTYPLSLILGTCGADLNKIAKVFIDWNGNGVFEANELVATTPVLSSTGTYTTNITVPATVTPGNYSMMRVVLSETTDASTILACGSYAKGETQDYRVQFLQTSIDAGVVAIVSPATGGACSGAVPVTVTLKNYGSTTLNSIPVTVSVASPAGVVATFNGTYAGSLAPAAQDNFTFSSPFNITAGTTYIISAATNLAADPVTNNNQVIDTVVVASPPTATALAANFCNAISSYLLSGTGDGELLWYHNSTDVIPFAYGTPTITTHAPVNNTYYAGLNDFSGTIGPAAKTAFTAGGYNQFTPAVNVFTRIPLVISTARLYIGNPGKITFTVADQNGEVVSSTTINAVATTAFPHSGALPDDPTDNGQVYDLNLLLPSAGIYSISANFADTATIYRNNGGVTGYPFKIGDVFGIIGNTATSTTDTAYYKNFYYYFYDMHVTSPGCASVAKQVVTVVNPVITQSGTILSSNFTTGNQWYLNGVAINGATSQTYSPTRSGNYRVDIPLANGCVAQSANFVYVVLAANTGDNDIGLTLFPVPTKDQLSVVFASKDAANMNISLINSAGKSTYSTQKALPAGNFSTVLDVSQLPPGTYVLKLLLNQKKYTKKVIIDR
ncbi:MAG: S8 family serine peptidase [Sphingobacteriales bacterium]